MAIAHPCGRRMAARRSPRCPHGAQPCWCPCRKMLRLCGEAEDKLAQELIHFELQVERDVIEPLFVLAEVSGRRGGPRVGVSPRRGLASETSLGESRVSLLQWHIWFLAPARDLPPLRWLLIALISRQYLHVLLGWLLGQWPLPGPFACPRCSCSFLPPLKAEALTLLFLTHFFKLQTHSIVVWDIFLFLLFLPAANFVFLFYPTLFPPPDLLHLAKCPRLGSDFIFTSRNSKSFIALLVLPGRASRAGPELILPNPLANSARAWEALHCHPQKPFSCLHPAPQCRRP